MPDEINKADATRMIGFAARMFNVDPARFSLHASDHEGLSEGAWSIAYEGFVTDWPSYVSLMYRQAASIDAEVFDAPRGLLVEAMNGWSLAIYPTEGYS